MDACAAHSVYQHRGVLVCGYHQCVQCAGMNVCSMPGVNVFVMCAVYGYACMNVSIVYIVCIVLCVVDGEMQHVSPPLPLYKACVGAVFIWRLIVTRYQM